MPTNLQDIDFLFLPLRGDYLRTCGREATEWIRAVQTEDVHQLARGVDRSMQFLKKKELAIARDHLREVEEGIARLASPFASISFLLLRYLLAARAYLHYLEGDLEAAKEDLRQARCRLVAVLTDHAFLWPLAVHLIDLYSQEARIARREHRWGDASAQVGAIRKIYLQNEPICTLGSGRPLRMSDLRAFFSTLPLDDQQREQAAVILGDDGSIAERARQLEEQVFALPDFVIPYP